MTNQAFFVAAQQIEVMFPKKQRRQQDSVIAFARRATEHLETIQQLTDLAPENRLPC
jgi:hypothetical protein